MTVPRLLPLALLALMAGCRSAPHAAGAVASSNARTRQPISAPVVEGVAYTESAEVPDTPDAPDLPLPAPEPGAELSLGQLEEMALANNPTLDEAQANVDAARGNWIQVGLPPNTIVGYSGQQLGSGGAAEQRGLYVEQQFIRGGKLRLNRAMACQEIEKAEQLTAAQKLRVLTDVRLGYYDVLIARRRTELTQRLQEIAEDAVQTSEALLKAKEVSQADVMHARVELQSVQLLHSNAVNQQTAVWSRLTAVLGLPDLPPRPIAGDIGSIGETIDYDAALRRLLSESPEMAAALAEVERSRWAIQRAHAETVPNVDVQAVVQSDNGTGGSDAGLQISLPIPWLDRNQGGIRQAHAELVVAERDVTRLELSLKQRLAGLYQQYASARHQVEEYSKPGGILENSRSALDSVRKGYQAGEIGHLELLTVQRTYSQANLAYIEALGDLWSTIVQIEGLLLKDSLTNAGSAP